MNAFSLFQTKRCDVTMMISSSILSFSRFGEPQRVKSLLTEPHLELLLLPMSFILYDAGTCTYLTHVLIFLFIKDRNSSGGGS